MAEGLDVKFETHNQKPDPIETSPDPAEDGETDPDPKSSPDPAEAQGHWDPSLISTGLDVVFKGLATALGDHWELSPMENQALVDPTKDLLDEVAPAGPETSSPYVNFSISLFPILYPRIAKTLSSPSNADQPRGQTPDQDQEENPADKPGSAGKSGDQAEEAEAGNGDHQGPFIIPDQEQEKEENSNG